jgi:hypothetical protein
MKLVDSPNIHPTAFESVYSKKKAFESVVLVNVSEHIFRLEKNTAISKEPSECITA